MKNSTYTLTSTQHAFVTAVRPYFHGGNFGKGGGVMYSELLAAAKRAGYSAVPAWCMTASRKSGRGFYMLPEIMASDSDITVIAVKRGRPAGAKTANSATKTPAPAAAPASRAAAALASVVADSSVATRITTGSGVSLTADAACMVASLTGGERTSFTPDTDSNYIAWGYHSEIETIIASKAFCPVFITGMSGNGKTTMVEQVCAKLGRECIRVNFTVQTDEDELLGGFRLIAGETKFVPGPVLVAMERGAVLLLDEVDLGGHAIMCLQSVLEGKGKFIPKIGQYVRPAAGFTIVATANTKGKGSADGRFAGTNQLNEAFLDRFHFCYEQDYAEPKVEKKILKKYAGSLGVSDDDFMDNLVNWADLVRKSFKQQIVNEIITTRRLRDIVFAFSVFGDKMQAIERCVSRFDEETKNAFTEFYTKIDATAKTPDPVAAPVDAAPAASTKCPF
jgi:hypothetical protein